MRQTYVYNLGHIFQHVAKVQEHKVAIKFIDGATITFGELNKLSDKISCYLLSLGIGRNDVVAILNNKSRECFAVMIACLKSGITYTNLDPNSPHERLKKMIQVCRPVHYFTDIESQFDIVKGLEIKNDNITDCSILSEKGLIVDHQYDLDEVVNKVTGDTPAYLMFTSGSTGFPKGVLIAHSSVLNFVRWARSTFSITNIDVLTNLNPMYFDNSVFDFYASLFNGASMLAIPEGTLRIPRKLLDMLNELKPTIWFSVPSLLVYITKMRAWKKNDLPDIRLLSFGGEGYPKSQLRTVWSLFSHRVEFINVYGPTEGTCICSSYLVTKDDIKSDDLLPLGPIAPNFDYLIVDGELKGVKDGAVGELCLMGPNLAKGYYNNPEKTNESFVPAPLDIGYNRTMYKTGDLVNYDNKKGVLRFNGRIDNQIKRMGYRIELEEIEVALGTLAKVHENAVIYKLTSETGGLIVAFVSGEYQADKQLLEDLRGLLPQYMIPNEVVFLDHLPKNQNGKIDRKALKREYCR